ncbi:hypothetical protein WMO40_21270 [Bacillaceae bacterium CLA-AA-H227]|uniref:Uncharacterized protein n=1 Tax=Robertmurraya yapensis (ex Hitch et al 2024) TaxID=3133160 RepID=A0ACC6SJL8_9BACI
MTIRTGKDISTQIDLFSLEFFQTFYGNKHSKFEAFYYLLKEFYGEIPLSADDYTPCQNFTIELDCKQLEKDWQWDTYDIMMFFKTLAYDKIIVLHKFGYDYKIECTLNSDWEQELTGRKKENRL